MPKIKINNNEYEFPVGTNVLDACKQINVHVPYFCYHPVLKVVGSCRMCKVEVTQGGRSRIDISCNVQVADGMEIQTATPEVRKARQMTLEFLLKNHPLECPICDDAGECKLQDYYFKYGQHDSRLVDPKIHKRKAFDVGNKIVLDSERCVLCSRCVRFLSDVTHTNELGIFGMGSHEELMLSPGSRLDNDYSGNVVDLCPVGALTDKDFRFKRRVWYLKSVPSICQGCSRGCNVRIDYDLNPFHLHKKDQMMKTHRTETTELQRIQRIKPNENEAVNGHWMCDHGRYSYRDTDSADRLQHAMIKLDGELKQVEMSEAIQVMADEVNRCIGKKQSKMAVVVSPKATNEDLFAIRTLFRTKLELAHLDHRVPPRDEWHGDNLLRTPDPFPNRTGCEWIGIEPEEGGIGIADLSEKILSGKIDTVLTILADPRDFLDEEALKKLKNRFVILRNISTELESWVDAALPAAAWGEYKGSFTNFHGRVQRLEAAFDPLGDAQPVWKLITQLAAAVKKPIKWREYDQMLAALSRNIKFYEGCCWETIGSTGITVGEKKMNVKAAG